MQSFPNTLIIRHRLENLKKCSLRGLESRSDFIFVTYPYKSLPEINNYIVLALDAPPLSAEDQNHGLVIVDATWRYATKMLATLNQVESIHYRSLPNHYRTAYPRRQNDCIDPERGLASIEALYLSFSILGRDTKGLLDNYYWRDDFLIKNGLQ